VTGTFARGPYLPMKVSRKPLKVKWWQYPLRQKMNASSTANKHVKKVSFQSFQSRWCYGMDLLRLEVGG